MSEQSTSNESLARIDRLWLDCCERIGAGPGFEQYTALKNAAREEIERLQQKLTAAEQLAARQGNEIRRLQRQKDNLLSTVNSKQAKIDALMLEFLPGEMSAEQRKAWAESQQAAEDTVEVLRGTMEGGSDRLPVCEDELRLISEHGQPHGIRDRSGYLFFFKKVDKYSGQEDRYRRELAQMFRLADYLLRALRATVTKSAAAETSPSCIYRSGCQHPSVCEGRGVCVPGGEAEPDTTETGESNG